MTKQHNKTAKRPLSRRTAPDGNHSQMRPSFVMKRALLIACLLAATGGKPAAQNVSAILDFRSLFPNAVEEKTRTMYYGSLYSPVFIDDVSSTYLCEHNYFSFALPTPNLYRYLLPSTLRMADMERYGGYLWFCGSNNNEGIYGRFSWNISYNSIHLFWAKLPDMNNLRRFTYATQMAEQHHRRIFAIGETTVPSKISHILELDITGIGYSEFDPYPYATPVGKEFIDDLKLVGDRIVFSTRDFNPNHSQVNLRISDIENVVGGTEINHQWQFLLGAGESVVGEVFITRLIGEDIEVSYIKYCENESTYKLCMHRIILPDFLMGVNTIISQEMIVPKGDEIVDIVYDPARDVAVYLLNRMETRSVFIHTMPYSTISYSSQQIVSSEDERYFSLDTVDNSNGTTGCGMYTAWGGGLCFSQEYSTNGQVSFSCYSIEKASIELVSPVKIEHYYNPLTISQGTRPTNQDDSGWTLDSGVRNCFGYLK